jgi:hypothetical protein
LGSSVPARAPVPAATIKTAILDMLLPSKFGSSRNIYGRSRRYFVALQNNAYIIIV